MLVLTRQVDEEIIIGNQIVVKVLAVHGNQVRLGIEAPREVEVYRREVYEQIAAATKEAAEARPDMLRGVLKGKRGPAPGRTDSAKQGKEPGQ
ncbi:MAG: carbon storage regulator CsrA [Armatimonadetes bacterium]|nr:carbon storage regulator CsrA [Armatimonadota bacterium]